MEFGRYDWFTASWFSLGWMLRCGGGVSLGDGRGSSPSCFPLPLPLGRLTHYHRFSSIWIHCWMILSLLNRVSGAFRRFHRSLPSWSEGGGLVEVVAAWWWFVGWW